ncbi:MAG: hypothetical protein ACYTE8_01055 [Planctomycetota bacterium]|jgi:hypothetical protein
MDKRKQHCSMAKLNRFGRCIAYCRHNVEDRYETDCTGKKRVSDTELAKQDAIERNLH